MKSFIGFGIVYQANQTLQQEVENTADILEGLVSQIEVHLPNEETETGWEHKLFDGNWYGLMEDLTINYSYASMQFDVDGRNCETQAQIKNEGDHVVFKLEISEENMYGTEAITTNMLNDIEAFFIEVIMRFDAAVDHAYIFCDNEADYIYSAERLNTVGYIPYSLLKRKDRELEKASWYLDGFTEKKVNLN